MDCFSKIREEMSALLQFKSFCECFPSVLRVGKDQALKSKSHANNIVAIIMVSEVIITVVINAFYTVCLYSLVCYWGWSLLVSVVSKMLD